MADPDRNERAARAVLVGLVVSAAAAVGFGVAFALDAGTQWLGLSLAVALGGLGYGMVAWGHRLMPPGGEVEERKHMRPSEAEELETAEFFEQRTGGIKRRGLLGGAIATALGVTGIASIFPLRALGPSPRDELRYTDFALVPRPRLVTSEGLPVHRDQLPIGGFLTVFPEGYAGSADAQTALMRLGNDVELRPPTRTDWVADGHIAYSKICTHAGCPVGLYQVEQQVLICPCHQSTFRVTEGAKPSLGPAARPLPQLPLAVDDDGFLIATGDYPDAAGPGWWTRPSDAGEGTA